MDILPAHKNPKTYILQERSTGHLSKMEIGKFSILNLLNQ